MLDRSVLRELPQVPPQGCKAWMEVIAYASRTGTKRNLAGLRDRGWRLLVSARGVLRTEGFRYALDNGAWTAHQAGEVFDALAFVKALDLLGPAADWIVVPDIVGDGLRSLEFSYRWLPRVLAVGPGLLAVQDGMEPRDVEALLGPQLGLFVGGSTEWKLRTLPAWCELGRRMGVVVHVGRVNSAKRINLCAYHGATSFDGSSASRYAVELPGLDNALRQLPLGLVTT